MSLQDKTLSPLHTRTHVIDSNFFHTKKSLNFSSLMCQVSHFYTKIHTKQKKTQNKQKKVLQAYQNV